MFEIEQHNAHIHKNCSSSFDEKTINGIAIEDLDEETLMHYFENLYSDITDSDDESYSEEGPRKRPKYIAKSIVKIQKKLRESGYEEQVEKNDSYLSTEVKQIQVLERLLSQYDLQYAYKDILTKPFDFELAKYFINHGVNINLSTNDGSCAIHAACLFGDLQFLNFLVKQPKIDLDKKDLSGNTALHISISRESRGCIECLIINGADLNIPHGNGNTPLLDVTLSRDHGLCKWLVEQHADINIV